MAARTSANKRISATQGAEEDRPMMASPHDIESARLSMLEARELTERIAVGAQERTLLGLFGQMRIEDRELLKSFAREMVKQKGKRE